MHYSLEMDLHALDSFEVKLGEVSACSLPEVTGAVISSGWSYTASRRQLCLGDIGLCAGWRVSEGRVAPGLNPSHFPVIHVVSHCQDKLFSFEDHSGDWSVWQLLQGLWEGLLLEQLGSGKCCASLRLLHL